MLGRASLESVDAQLWLQARAQAVQSLRLGQLLEVLGRGACFELGFSSLAAYARERCERSTRWVEGARCLARRLEALPLLREALARGGVGWSVAELIARVARSDDEAVWLAVAARLSVRQLRERVGRALRGGAGGAQQGAEPAQAVEAAESGARTLARTVDCEDAWLFEATRALLEALGAFGTRAQVEALLAEGQESLLAVPSRDELDVGRDEEVGVGAQRLWQEQRARWREAAEVRCEAGIRRRPLASGSDVAGGGDVGCDAASGLASFEGLLPAELDAAVREVSGQLARHELALAQLALRFHRDDGWRRLGYATESQYARERLGLSRSTLVARRTLALRLERLPAVEAALGAGQIGVEAATQLSRVATPVTEGAWLERARLRTVKHLHEEVSASLVVVRLSGERDCPPPLDAEIDAFHDLERAALGGGVREGVPSAARGDQEPSDRSAARRRPWRSTLRSLAAWLASSGLGGEGSSVARVAAGGVSASGVSASGVSASGVSAGGASENAASVGVQTSAGRAVASAGRVRLRLHVDSDLRDWWQQLERQARRWLPRGTSFVRFLCESVWRGWRHLLGVRVAYGGIYLRDRHRCTSPACNRRDVTPHHLRFRSAGGGDEADNLASVCTWCHLAGIHEGRIRARGRAGRVRWELGRGQPCLVVEGRDKLAQAA